MKKICLVCAVVMVACWAGMASAYEQIQKTAEEAFRIASRPNDDPIVGVWRMHPRSGGKVAHMAIVPNTTNRQQSWSYLGIMLEDGFEIKKNGAKIALRQTSFANTYDVILSNRVSTLGAVYLDGGGLAFLQGAVLDMNLVKVPYVEIETMFDRYFDRYAPITHMVKVRNFQMEMAGQFSLSGLYFDGLIVNYVDPGSLGFQAGIQPGDAIAEINGRPADEELLKEIDSRLAAGRSVMIVYTRDGYKDLVTLRIQL